MSNSLYLFPRDIHAPPPALALLLNSLREIGLIGALLDKNRFLAGDDLLQHISFAGCSPHLKFEPAAVDDRDFCHVALHGPYDQAHMFTGPHTQDPRCPKCRQRNDRQLLEQMWRSADDDAVTSECSHCKERIAIEHWRWRRLAVFGRLLVAVRSVFPNEALPSDLLLMRLERDTGMPWDYGWAATQDEDKVPTAS